MKAETLLDSVVFQLTPTRTRYDLVIIANGKTEKIGSGLLDPFLAHLKTAEDQITKGGYSIRLEPERGAETSWFTKDTVERFVRYVSTPEVLDRVNTLESEILQINEAIAIQGNDNLCSSIVEDHQSRGTGSVTGSKYSYNGDKEKAILSEHGKHRRLSTGSTTQEVNSRRQLLRVLESRKTVLRKEQGMAFARAVAAGFDIDHMPNLILFAKNFGASRLLEACMDFVELWKARHKNGQWLETVGADFIAFQNEFTPLKASCDIPSHDLAAESNEKNYHNTASNLNLQQLNSDHTEDSSSLLGPRYYHGQNPMLLQWSLHGPPLCNSYPIQSMPYHESYLVGGSSFQSHDPIKMALKRDSMDNKIGGIESTTWEDFSNTMSLVRADQNVADFRKKTRRCQKSHKEVGHSGKRRSHTKHMTNDKSGSESQSTSDAGSQNEIQDLQSAAPSRYHKDSSMLVNTNGGSIVDGQDGDGGNWQTFQTLLLRIQSEDTNAIDSSSNDSQVRRRLNKSKVDPRISSTQKNGDKMFSDPISENEFRNASNLYNNSVHNVNDESFMVPIRSGLHDELVKDKRTDIVHVNSDFHSAQRENNDFHNYEPNDLIMMPERGLEKRSISFDPAKDFDMPIQNGIKKEIKSQERVSKRAKEGLKGLGKERKLSNGPYGLEKRKLDAMAMKVKSSKLNPLSDAKARAEKLRAFKTDLQKIKKEKEEEERKRLEALKRERQKRIAARSSLNDAHSSLHAPQTKARKITGQVSSSSNISRFTVTAPTSFSPLRKLPQSSTNITHSPLKPKHIGASMTTISYPNSYKSSKFSDMQPSPSSPLLKLLRSKNVAQSTSSPQKNTVQKPTRLFPSSSPVKKSPSNISKNIVQPVRVHSSSYQSSKFSDIASSSSPSGKITKLDRLNDSNESRQSATSVSRLLVEVSTARIQIKRVATPESSKIHNQMAKNKIVTMREPIEKVKKKAGENRRGTSSNPESMQTKKANKAVLTLRNYEDDPIVEKTVVILEDKTIPSPGISHEDGRRERIELVSEHQALHVPPTTFVGAEVDKSREYKLDKQPSSYQVMNPPIDISQKSSNSLITENPNPTSFARAYIEEPPTSTINRIEEHAGPDIINARACKLVDSTSVEQRHKMQDKPHSKGSLKGFKDLLKFPCKGKHSSSSELHADISAADPRRMVTTASNNVPTLKDLFSKVDHPGGTPNKASRHLSSFSPFHSKSGEKKDDA